MRENEYDASAEPIHEALLKIAAQVPEADWDAVPTNAASGEHDAIYVCENCTQSFCNTPWKGIEPKEVLRSITRCPACNSKFTNRYSVKLARIVTLETYKDETA